MEGTLHYKLAQAGIDLAMVDPQLVKQAFEALPNPNALTRRQCGLCETCQHDPTAHSQCDGNAPEDHHYSSWHEEVNGLVYLTTDQNVAHSMPEIRQKALEDLSHYIRPCMPEYGDCKGCEAGAECDAAHTCR
jgi:hypothetical protein